MLKQSALVSVLTIAALGSGCGSEDSGEGSSGGTTGIGGNLNLGGFGTGGSTFGPGMHDGGTIPLTPEQVDDIENSSCAGWSTEGEPLPAVLELVVDVSGSMESPPPNGNTSKWNITRDALSEALDVLSPQTAVGVVYYPNMGQEPAASEDPRPVDACVNTDAMIDIDLLGPQGSPHRDALQASLMDANTGGGTPTHDAYQYALDNGMRAFVTDLSKFMLLITDGQPTFSQECIGTGYVDDPVNEQPIVDAVEAAAASGIRTFIIGSPGSEQNLSTNTDARPWLSRAAIAGGTALPGCSENGPDYCHMDMSQEPDFAAALAQGLGTIAGQINACTYVIPEPPSGQVIDMTKANLIVTSSGEAELVLPDDMGACTEGWQVQDGQVVLCEATCARVQEDGTATIRLMFGCNSGQVPVVM